MSKSEGSLPKLVFAYKLCWFARINKANLKPRKAHQISEKHARDPGADSGRGGARVRDERHLPVRAAERVHGARGGGAERALGAAAGRAGQGDGAAGRARRGPRAARGRGAAARVRPLDLVQPAARRAPPRPPRRRLRAAGTRRQRPGALVHQARAPRHGQQEADTPCHRVLGGAHQRCVLVFAGVSQTILEDLRENSMIFVNSLECFRIFKRVIELLSIFLNISRSLRIFQNHLECFTIFKNVLGSLRIYM